MRLKNVFIVKMVSLYSGCLLLSCKDMKTPAIQSAPALFEDSMQIYDEMPDFLFVPVNLEHHAPRFIYLRPPLSTVDDFSNEYQKPMNIE